MMTGRGAFGALLGISVAGLGVWYGVSRATDIPVAGGSVSISVSTLTGKQSLKASQKDPLISFGPAGTPSQLSGQLEVYYVDTPSNRGVLSLPSPWLSNTGVTAKFKNSLAPGGPTTVRSATIKNGKIDKVGAKGAGGLNINLPPGANGIITVLTINNAADASVHRMCSKYAIGSGSFLQHKVTGSGFKLKAKKGVAVACPVCGDGFQNGNETGVDCGGDCSGCPNGGACNTGADCASGVCTGNVCQAPTCSDTVKNGNETGTDCGGGTCPTCPNGSGCSVDGDCQSSVCGAFICQAPSCSDAHKNGTESDVDCGGSCPDCGIGGHCNSNADCTTNSCSGGTCKCPSQLFTFTVNSNNGGSFDSAEWPGGTQIGNGPSGCSVTIQNPNNNVDLVCSLANPFAVLSKSGYSSCAGTGGEDGDGCSPLSCPPAGVGSCCNGRPSCSAALNGSGSARYFVQCNP